MIGLLAFVAVAALAWLFILGLRRWMTYRRIFDVPNERSSHSRPTPRGGGLAIVLLTLAAGGYLLATGEERVGLSAYLIGGGLIALISWLDDLRSIENRARFACHAIGAALILSTIGKFPPLLAFEIPWWALAAGLGLWIVVGTNIYNFMDGIDGLAGGQAVVAALWWVIVGNRLDIRPVTILALALASSATGFLLHNWPPARIFMGDVGSAFIGFTLAVLPLIALQATGRWVLLVGGVLAIWPFLFDSLLTLCRRALAGENIFRAHRSHLYQRLTGHGWTHRAVTSLYLAYAIICAGCASLVLLEEWRVAVVPPAIGVVLFLLVRRVELQGASTAAA